MSLPDSMNERRRQGAQVRREVLGEAYVGSTAAQADPFYQHFLDFTVEQCWGNVWLRPGLEQHTRSLLNLAMLSVLGRWHEFEVHVRGALNNGVSREQIAEVLLQAGVYSGVPIASEGFRRARELFARIDAAAPDAQTGPQAR
jgi:4-carboxymuconolactone decarboxylase